MVPQKLRIKIWITFITLFNQSNPPTGNAAPSPGPRWNPAFSRAFCTHRCASPWSWVNGFGAQTTCQLIIVNKQLAQRMERRWDSSKADLLIYHTHFVTNKERLNDICIAVDIEALSWRPFCELPPILGLFVTHRLAKGFVTATVHLILPRNIRGEHGSTTYVRQERA